MSNFLVWCSCDIFICVDYDKLVFVTRTLWLCVCARLFRNSYSLSLPCWCRFPLIQSKCMNHICKIHKMNGVSMCSTAVMNTIFHYCWCFSFAALFHSFAWNNMKYQPNGMNWYCCPSHISNNMLGSDIVSVAWLDYHVLQRLWAFSWICIGCIHNSAIFDMV